jgi:cytochrome c-type biogenesis protein CcsB
VIDPTWAARSNDLLTATVVLYALAMLAYAGEYARARGRSRGTGERRRTIVARASATLDAVALDEAVFTPPVTGAGARLGMLAVALTVAGWATHVGSVVSRGLAADRVPWGNMYEFSSAVTLSAVTAYLVLLARRDVRFLGVFVMVPAVLTLGIASTLLYSRAEPLQPALNDYWIKIHVTAAITASGAFMVGAVLSALYLVQSRRPEPSGLMRRVPDAQRLDQLAARVHAFAFPVWTFAIVSGAIWAERAWGRYWGWDPKETWSFITWLVYAGYLHARATGGWKGRRAAILALVGFSALTIDYYLVNTVIVGLHSYAGV